MVVGVEFLNVKAVSALMHVDVCTNGTLDLNGVSSITFLCV